MPPKAKGKKKEAKDQPPAEIDVLSTEEMSKDQLEELIVRLREELDREREERGFYQQERDKVRALWEICKRNLEEKEAELRNTERERREAQERHRVEIAVYKKKLLNVMSEQHNTLSELKIDGVAATSLLQHGHTESELKLRKELHSLQEHFRKMKIENANHIKELKLKHQVERMEQVKDYEARIREQAMKEQRQMQIEQKAEEEKHQAEIETLMDDYRSQAETLVKEQREELLEAGLSLERALAKKKEREQKQKETSAQLEKILKREEKKFTAAKQENERLQRFLQEAEQRLRELEREREENEKAKAEMVRSKARQKVIEKELRDLGVEHELLQVAVEKIEQERDELLKKQTEALLDMEQRSQLKEMKLKMKVAQMEKAVEKVEAQLCVALSFSNKDKDQAAAAAANERLQEILESKDAAVRALEGDLTRECQEYDQLLQTHREKTTLYNNPLRSSKQILAQHGSDRVQEFARVNLKK